MENQKITSSKEVTPKIIEAWQKENSRGIFEIRVDSDMLLHEDKKTKEKGYVKKVGWVRKPTRVEIGASMTMHPGNALGQKEELLRDCWLGGDIELLDDDDYYLGVLSTFGEIMEVRNAEIKKL